MVIEKTGEHSVVHLLCLKCLRHLSECVNWAFEYVSLIVRKEV